MKNFLGLSVVLTLGMAGPVETPKFLDGDEILDTAKKAPDFNLVACWRNR